MGSTASSAAMAATKISVKPARTTRSASCDNNRQARKIRKPDQILEENVRLRKKILKLEEELTANKLNDENVCLRRSNEELANEVKQLKGLLMVVDGSPTLCVRSTFSVNSAMSAQSDPSDDRLVGGRRSWAHQFSTDDSTQDLPNSSRSSPGQRLLSESRANKLSKLRSLPIQDGHGLFPMNDIEAYGKGLALTRTDDHREKTLENIRSYRAEKKSKKSGDEQGEENGQ
ncbi:Hypp7741 [Branchiostoma lanceolatum]|uniref:Hypp7741 protein n=1 Tax=Branchiostoma lanceolatum TaxID=7740 RepID=A0A8J9Z2N2_BRALA|nr:Hypp7741 [Branchiostoma lanceolatum]